LQLKLWAYNHSILFKKNLEWHKNLVYTMVFYTVIYTYSENFSIFKLIYIWYEFLHFFFPKIHSNFKFFPKMWNFIDLFLDDPYNSNVEDWWFHLYKMKNKYSFMYSSKIQHTEWRDLKLDSMVIGPILSKSQFSIWFRKAVK